MIIRARAPLRLGLAGGGTDVSPYCDLYDGIVLNATIDRYAYASIKILNGQETVFIASDLILKDCIKLNSAEVIDKRLKLHHDVYEYMMQTHNAGSYIPVELTTFCDAPIGSGLGSSSTLVVAMIKVFVELLNLTLDDYEIANLAFKIERIDCGLEGGRQDQFSAAYGGFNFMEFYANNKTIVNSLRIKPWIISELEASLILFFSGISRESAKIISAHSQKIENQDIDALNAMHGLKKEAISMKESLLQGDFRGIVNSMQLGWENKKRSAALVSNAYIDEIYQSALNAGALAGKISGAGGGGFMLFFINPARRLDVIRALNYFDGQVSNCHFTKQGVQSWRIW